MEETGLWLTPLVLLPGVALLVLSTSIRYGQIHEEFHHLLEMRGEVAKATGERLWARAHLFRDALVGLYVSVCLLAVGAMLGGLASLWFTRSDIVVVILTFLGVAAVIYSSIQLIRESSLSLEIVKQHMDDLRGGE
ncbi:MAG: DUF2721 domain-containing protein [Gemmatimonadota bacterium]|nr:DUF2721 domain-containing protein [Gemmatimonadota bacterium]